MIGRLRGTLIEKQAPQLVLDVGGVGYEVDAPMTTFYNLPALGESVMLYTHLVVREDAHLLYGFHSREERSVFRSLIKISGVGAKLALTILSGISADELARVVHDNDIGRLTAMPGIGKKTAERLLVELRDRLKDMPESPAAGMPMGGPDAAPVGAIGDAVSALIALGYKPQEASRMVRSVETEGMSSEEIIRHALKGAA